MGLKRNNQDVLVDPFLGSGPFFSIDRVVETLETASQCNALQHDTLGMLKADSSI